MDKNVFLTSCPPSYGDQIVDLEVLVMQINPINKGHICFPAVSETHFGLGSEAGTTRTFIPSSVRGVSDPNSSF